MKVFTIVIATLVLLTGNSSAQKLPEVFDIEFAVYPSDWGESFAIGLSSMKDPLMASLINKQILAQLELDISNKNTLGLYIENYPTYSHFTNELFMEKMTYETEYFVIDEYGDELSKTEIIESQVSDLIVSLNFSVGYDLDKHVLSAKLVSADFMLTVDEDYSSHDILIMRKIYGKQPNFEMTDENDKYSNMAFDDSFESQDYNYFISVPLLERKGWATMQKSISYLPLSKVYFEKNEIPESVYSSHGEEEVSFQSTLVQEYEIEDMDEFGDFVYKSVKDSITVNDVLVYYKITCALDKVMKVKKVSVIGYGVQVNENEEGLIKFYYIEPK